MAVSIFAIVLVAGLFLQGGETATTVVSVEPADAAVSVPETTTFDIVVESASGGVGSYNATVWLADPEIAAITGVDIEGSPISASGDVRLSRSDSRAAITANLTETQNTDRVVIATITVAGIAVGTTTLSVSVPTLEDEEANRFEDIRTNAAELTVGSQSDADIQVVQNRSAVRADPGGTVTVTASVRAPELNGPALRVDLPHGWSMAGQSTTGLATYNSEANTWLWLAGGEYTVTYTVSVPRDADPGHYTISANGSAIDPDSGRRILESAESRVTVK